MCGAATHRLSRSLTATPGAARRPARTVSAWAAHRPRAAWASSRSPCTVTDRTRLRPDTRSGPSAIRNSHTPGRRCRSDPEPRALFVMLDRRHGSATLGPRQIEGYWDSYWDGRRGALPEAPGLAGVCARHGRYQASAPEGIRTPNLLIRSSDADVRTVGLLGERRRRGPSIGRERRRLATVRGQDRGQRSLGSRRPSRTSAVGPN